MAYLTRQNPNRGLVGELLGVDPLRNFFANAATVGGMDVHRSEAGYTVEIPVPGFRPDQIDVTVEDRIVTVSGENERRRFTRSLGLPDEIDAETIAANVEHGLLTLTLRIHAKAQPRKIAVSVSGNAANAAEAQPTPVGASTVPSQN